MAPVVRALRADRRFDVVVGATAQHRGLLDLMLRDLSYAPDIDLDLMRPGQTLSTFLPAALRGLDRVLGKAKPDVVLAQGDTATVLAAALTAFDRKILFGHVEAGLRSFDKWAPFPEEKIRVMTDHVSDLLFAPTALANRNLLREGIDPASIFVTGNTAVDAVLWAAARPHEFSEPALKRLPASARVAIVTLHRRESFGAPLESVLHGIAAAADRYPELLWVYPVHPNPNVLRVARRVLLHPRILLMPPLGYLDFVHLMKRAEFVVTDSGGIQEEAPSLGLPVLVMRAKTERPEALAGGLTRVVGVSGKDLLVALARLPKSRRARPPRNPFGDGRAGERIAEALLYRFGRRGRRPNEKL